MRSAASGGGPFVGFAVGRPAPYTSYTTAQQNQGQPQGHYVPSGGVRALQTFLHNKGYAIQVDGVRGPQTEAAIAAYHDGVSPQAWNKRSVHAGAPVRSTAGKGGPAPRHITPPRRSVATGRPPVSRTNPIAAAAAAQSAATGGTDPSGNLTPAQIAQAQIDSVYTPQLNEIQRQIDAANANAAAQQQQIAAGYGAAGQTAQASANQMSASDAALMAQQQQGNQNMLQLFGGPDANGSAKEAGAFGDINAAALAQLSAANESAAQNYVPIIATQGQETQTQARNAANQAIAELAGQLSDLKFKKSTDYTTALYQAQQDQYNHQQDVIKNQQAQQALDLANALMPAQVRTANAKASLAQTQARLAPIQAQRDAKAFGMSMKRYQAELAATRARTKQILASAKNSDGTIDWNDPNTRASLAQQLRGVIQSKQGTWRMHPGAAQQNLNLALQQLGLQNNPNAIAIRNQLLQETVTNSHAVKQWGQFNYANGKIVKTGQRFKPRKPKK